MADLREFDYDGPERRQYKRVKLTLPVRYWVEKPPEVVVQIGREKFSARTIDLTEAGAGLLTDQPLPPLCGVRLQFVITEHLNESSRHYRFVMSGEIRYCACLQDGRFHCGVSYGEVDDGKENLFYELICS